MPDLTTATVLDHLVDVAARVITPRFRSLHAGEVMEKNPGDLVTVADREAEALLTEVLEAAYPGVLVLGEEAVSADPTLLDRFAEAEHSFTVDPVDGTKNFVHGSPDHAVMVAELRDGVTQRSWIWQPEHRVAWVAERGGGVWRDGRPFVRDPRPAGAPPRGVTSRPGWTGTTLGDLPPLTLTWLCCGVDYPRVLEGAADFVVYGRSHAWDHVPGALLTTESGGVVAHPDGSPWDPFSRHAGILVAADAPTYAAVAPLVAAAHLS